MQGGFSLKYVLNSSDNYLRWHDYYEILLIVKDSGTIQIGAKSYQLVPGEIFFMPPYVMHNVSSPVTENWELYSLHFSESIVYKNNDQTKNRNICAFSAIPAILTFALL